MAQVAGPVETGRRDEALVEFYRRAGRGHPWRHRIRGFGCVLGLGGSFVLWVVVGTSWSAVFALGAAAAVLAWCRQRSEVLRTGGLRWYHRRRGVVEVELLGGGHSWRRDLVDVAALSLRFEDRSWRSLEVEMVTAVFPASWLRAWGFEMAECGSGVEVFYRFVYRVFWVRWWIASRMGRSRCPRLRKRSCVEARHRMGPWMDTVASLPASLRTPRPGHR